MTHDVLQCDIDLARRLLEANRPESEIVMALTCRGIDSGRAAQLIAEIQSGQTVEPDKPITVNLPRKTAGPSAPAGQRHSPKDSSKRSHRNRPGQPDRGGFPWSMIIALAAAVVCVTAFAIISRKSHSDSQERSHVQVADSSGSTHSSRAVDAANISLEVQRDGLRLCNNAITREDFLGSVFNILGTPSRTNLAEKLQQVIYAYDPYGLLIYSASKTGDYSIVLDFEAIGGAAGTRNPFVGVFKINGNPLCATTDAASLGLISELGLQPTKSGSGILRAQFGGLELVFAYFKGPERLSLAEIDFK